MLQAHAGPAKVWKNGAQQSEIAAAVQQALHQAGIVTTVQAYSFGEEDWCGTFRAYSVDLHISIQLNASESKNVVEAIRSTLAGFAQFKVGNVTVTLPHGQSMTLKPGHKPFFAPTERVQLSEDGL